MTDFGVLAELALLLAVPVVPLVAGIMLRRRFPPAAPGGTQPGSGHKFGRLAGTLLLWGGVLAILLVIVFALNYKGKL